MQAQESPLEQGVTCPVLFCPRRLPPPEIPNLDTYDEIVHGRTGQADEEVV